MPRYTSETPSPHARREARALQALQLESMIDVGLPELNEARRQALLRVHPDRAVAGASVTVQEVQSFSGRWQRGSRSNEAARVRTMHAVYAEYFCEALGAAGA